MPKKIARGGDKQGRAEEELTSVNGFTVLRVRMVQLPFVHVLYVKAHRSKKHEDGTLPGDRTVFVANAGMGEEALRAALCGFGEIERVEMSGRGRQHAVQHSHVQAPAHEAQVTTSKDGPLHAHVVFSKKRACEAVLACNEVIEPSTTEDDGAEAAQNPGETQGGVRSWVQEYRSREIAEDELQASVDAYMTYFDERTEAEKRARRDRVVDEDGFELVTYKRKSHAPDITEQPKKKKKELVDFYRFQIREKKREELAALRNKFEADKRRVEAMYVPSCVACWILLFLFPGPTASASLPRARRASLRLEKELELLLLLLHLHRSLLPRLTERFLRIVVVPGNRKQRKAFRPM